MAKKVTKYSVEDLLYMPKEELIKIHNREAERRNKQITRAKKRGASTDVTGRRRTRLSLKTHFSRKEIIRRYQEMINAPDITLEGMIKDIAHAMAPDNEEFYNHLLNIFRKDSAAAIKALNMYKKLITEKKLGKLSSWRDVYYESLKQAWLTKRAVPKGKRGTTVITSFSPTDRRRTVYDIPLDELTTKDILQILEGIR